MAQAVVSTHSRPKAAGFGYPALFAGVIVSIHSRPKAAGDAAGAAFCVLFVSTHSRPKAAGAIASVFILIKRVSTHSRPKAAGPESHAHNLISCRFNTQPPEGGWADEGGAVGVAGFEFQHTAARRRLGQNHRSAKRTKPFQHTAARRRLVALSSGSVTEVWVSTHSRPKAAGAISMIAHTDRQFQHTAARRRLGGYQVVFDGIGVFQHTAARRRLAGFFRVSHNQSNLVSTHSRPKAAGPS